MKKLGLGWIIAIAWWLYFLTAIFLYIHGSKWVNTVDVLWSSALLIAFSVWYVIDKFRSGPGKSRWAFGERGVLYRRKSHECRGNDEPEETSEKRTLHKSRDHTPSGL
jgi:hypothetical protein